MSQGVSYAERRTVDDRDGGASRGVDALSL